MKYLKIYLTAITIFFLIDLLWLVGISKNLYKEQLGFLITSTPNFIAAGVFYLLFISGIVFFVINPALKKNSWKYALFCSMFFGLITYSTYDLTNLASINNWPVIITFIDLLWGTFLCGFVSLVTYKISSHRNWK